MVESVVPQRAGKLIVLSVVEIHHFHGLCPTYMHLVLSDPWINRQRRKNIRLRLEKATAAP